MDERIRRSRKQERDGANRFGGTVNSRSGAGDVRKNDVRTDTESIEFKITGAKSYSVKIYDLLKAWVIATIDSRKVIFGIEFIADSLTRQGPLRWVLLPEDDYLSTRDQVDSLRADNGVLEDRLLDLETALSEEGLSF